jgi:hypothetical protein
MLEIISDLKNPTWTTDEKEQKEANINTKLGENGKRERCVLSQNCGYKCELYVSHKQINAIS